MVANNMSARQQGPTREADANRSEIPLLATRVLPREVTLTSV